MKMWLARAHERPLFISLTCNFFCQGDDMMAPICPPFASYSRQREPVFLYLTPSLMDPLISVKNHLLKLQWLPVGYASQDADHRADVFQVATRLRSVELAEGISPRRVLLPWAPWLRFWFRSPACRSVGSPAAHGRHGGMPVVHLGQLSSPRRSQQRPHHHLTTLTLSCCCGRIIQSNFSEEIERSCAAKMLIHSPELTLIQCRESCL